MDDVMRRAILSQAARSVAPTSEFGSGSGGISSFGSLGDEFMEPLMPPKGEGKDDNVGKKARPAVIDEEYVEDDSPLPLSSVSAIIMTVILGGVGIASSAVSMVTMAGMVIVYVAGGLCVLNSVTLVKNQYEISKGKSYRQGINDLRKQAKRLCVEVDLLFKAVNDLQNEASLMQIFEEQLREISIKQGVSVEKIVSLTKENEVILNKQKANLKQTFFSDIAKAFISSEFLTGDMKVDIKNLPLLMMRLEIQLASHGLSINANEFEAMVKENNDISHIIKCCGDLLTKPNSKASGLVTINPEYAKGSLDVARGERPSLTSRPKLEYRNETVRNVMQGLSIRGINIDPDSSSISSDSDLDDEIDRLFNPSPPRRSLAPQPHPTKKHGTSGKDKTTSKFKAAAILARLGAPKRSNEVTRRGSETSGDGSGHTKTKSSKPSKGRGSSKDKRTGEGSRAASREGVRRRNLGVSKSFHHDASASRGSKESIDSPSRKPRMRRSTTMGASSISSRSRSRESTTESLKKGGSGRHDDSASRGSSEGRSDSKRKLKRNTIDRESDLQLKDSKEGGERKKRPMRRVATGASASITMGMGSSRTRSLDKRVSGRDDKSGEEGKGKPIPRSTSFGDVRKRSL